MLRKFIVSLLAVSLFSVHANAATNNNLKVVFDELNYALSVEWDQKDQTFYKNQMEKFNLNLEELTKQGVSYAEIIDEALATVKDKAAADDLRKAITLIGLSHMSPAEARTYLQEVMKKTYNNGASWSGAGGALYTIAGVLAVLVLTAVAGLVTGAAKIEDGCYKFRTCSSTYYGGTEIRDCDYECWY